ncbi:hypothetical protein AV530_016165 [Patagioenas fasciata monilis]|uniref:Reverse transcriptase domain-containing protein n=1 Tax=Patagioenas fasciata monilis TaxID=372326 RepID=A0A1V4JWA8_PATFA|nr:hypothetical protein AV530_016165 [Patagioenas fasciata monilis]
MIVVTGRLSEDWRKANVIPISKTGKEDKGKYRLANLTLIPGKVMKQLILKTISSHMKDKKVIKSSQHGFAKRKSCFTTLVIFYGKVTDLVEKPWILST